MLLNVVLHHLRVSGSNEHLALGAVAVHIAGDDCSLEGLLNILKAGMRLRDDLRVVDIHIGFRDVADRDHALEHAMVGHGRERHDIALIHHGPCLLQRHVFVDARCLPVLDIGNLGPHGRDELRLLRLEIFQYELRLTVRLTGATGDVALRACDDIFKPRVGDCRTDGIGIRVAVSRHQHISFRVVRDFCVLCFGRLF